MNWPKRKAPLGSTPQKFTDLVSVGASIAQDLQEMGIGSIAELAQSDAQTLYDRHCQIKGTVVDPCVLDTFHAAIAQARDPWLPLEKRQWWWWSQRRLAQKKGTST